MDQLPSTVGQRDPRPRPFVRFFGGLALEAAVDVRRDRDEGVNITSLRHTEACDLPTEVDRKRAQEIQRSAGGNKIVEIEQRAIPPKEWTRIPFVIERKADDVAFVIDTLAPADGISGERSEIPHLARLAGPQKSMSAIEGSALVRERRETNHLAEIVD